MFKLFFKFVRWTSWTFKGAMFMACLSLFAMFVALIAGDTWWAINDAVCVTFWVWVAFRAANPRPEDIAPKDMSLEQMRFRLRFLEQISDGLDKTIEEQKKMIEEKE